MIKTITKKTSNKKGFTLIELIVVIAILGILAAIAIPRFTGIRENANQSAINANLTSLQRAAEVAAAEQNTTVANIDTDEALTALGVTAAEFNGPGSVTYAMVAGDATATIVTAGDPALPETPNLKFSTIN